MPPTTRAAAQKAHRALAEEKAKKRLLIAKDKERKERLRWLRCAWRKRWNRVPGEKRLTHARDMLLDVNNHGKPFWSMVSKYINTRTEESLGALKFGVSVDVNFFQRFVDWSIAKTPIKQQLHLIIEELKTGDIFNHFENSQWLRENVDTQEMERIEKDGYRRLLFLYLQP